MTPTKLPDESDAIEIEPRPIIELVGRATALATVTRRGMLETTAEGDVYATDTDRFELYSWARSELRDWATPAELRLLGTPIGQLQAVDLADCDAALFGASAIAWALGVATGDSLPLPPDGAAEEATLAWAPEPWAAVIEAARTSSVRDETALATERERWELWYWRAIEVENSTEELAEVVASLRESNLLPIAGDDFATDSGLPYHDLDPQGQEEIGWLAELRLRALNWVCGFGDGWDEVPLYPD